MARQQRIWAVGVVLWLGVTTPGRAQVRPSSDPNQVAAKVERARLDLTPPDRYRLPIVLEPSRRVEVMAPADGALRGIAVPVGSTVREGQEIARLDTNGALARLKIAMASVKEMQAEVTISRGVSELATTVADARLDAAKARAELAQVEVESCTLRAPFAGRITAVYVSPGQYLAKGSAILQLDDVSSLRVFLPVDRTGVSVGGSVTFTVEGVGVSGKVQAVLPLTENQATLRELASPLASAWLTVPNPGGALEPGQRAQSPFLPNAPIAGVASYSLQKDAGGGPIVQVIRAERVTDVPVRILGALGPDRSQVCGPFRSSDVLIQTSSVPLRAGTFIRFNDAPGGRLEGQPPSPDQVGDSAEIAPANGVAPIGSGGRPGRPAPPASPGTNRPAGGGTVPF